MTHFVTSRGLVVGFVFVLGSCGSSDSGEDHGASSGSTSTTTTPSTSSTEATSTGSASVGTADTSGDTGEGSSTTGGEAACVPVEDLPRACNDAWIADGECDPVNNDGECTWDGGDCCESTCVDADIVCGDYGFDCRNPDAGGYGDDAAELLGDPCAPIDDPFDVAALQAEVELLSTDELGGRRPGYRGDAIARRYIEERFECLGLTPLNGDCYFQAFLSDDGDPTANIIGKIPGSDDEVADEIIVVGAHHDHLGWENAEIHNGANDNVSGVVALFAIAQALQTAAVAPRRTIVFIAFGAEETGLQGSVFYAANPPAELPMDNVVYMVNLDMLGTYDVAGSVDAFGTFEGTPGREILDELLGPNPDIIVNRGFASPEGDSDYDAFCDAGIPYVYFETFDEPCWHEPCDDAGRMDFPHLSQLAQIKSELIAELATTNTDLVAAREELGCAREPEQQQLAPRPAKHAHASKSAAPAKRRALHRRHHD